MARQGQSTRPDPMLCFSAQFVQQLLNRSHKNRQRLLRDVPHRARIDRCVAMDQLVSKSHDLEQVGNAVRQDRIQFGQLAERFPDDFELALYRCLHQFTAHKGGCVHVSRERLDRKCRVLHVQREARASRCIEDGFAVAVDAFQHIGIAHRAPLHQIHAAAQQLF